MPKFKEHKGRVTIVAIGASAGGLDPYERFFDITKDDSGVAYVIIQHLSPNFQSMMDELLARHSKMKIERVVDGMVVKPNTIYLNPPRTEMIISEGTFRLTDYSENKMLNLPIDTFFNSLAAEMGDASIAVVLSGTGSDGTKGANAIKAAGGVVMAQDLVSAKFGGMPGSIIKLGYADAVGNPEVLAENVGRLVRGLPLVVDPNRSEQKSPQQQIFQHLRERFGTEFNYYKTATIDRRLERRASLRNIKMEDYAFVVLNEPLEAEALYGDLLIEVTSFFRDPDAFEVLRTEVVPELALTMTKTRPVRIWVPGCASGEEAYSIAIMFAEYAREHNLDLSLKILATDIHHRSLDAASTGIYPRSSLGGLSQEQIERYFDTDDGTFQIKQHMRRMVVFSPHNILKDPPFTRMDLVSCRNVMIYFNDVAQQKTLALFHFSLRKEGFLCLGPSETTGKLESEFDSIHTKWRIYRKKRDVRLLESVSLLPETGAERDGFEAQNIRRSNTIGQSSPVVGPARQAHNDTLKELLRRYAPPGFLLNADGEIAHVFGDAGKFLRIESGLFSNRIVDLVDDEIKVIVSTGIERVKTARKLRFERKITTYNEDFGNHSVIIMIDMISQADAQQDFMLLTLERVKEESAPVDVSQILTMDTSEATGILQKRIADLERDLKATEESLQTTIEELETSNEELQATNEELMASNEELQSTNEELHSVNEELYTVSTEHQSKIEELMEVTDDLDHLLRATNIGIIFLDEDQYIRRFTQSAKETFNIISQDVGRPIDHITYRFEPMDLLVEIARVRQTGNTFEREIAVGDRWFMLRILPYRSSNGEILGSVITVIDVSDLKTAEHERAATRRNYETIVRDLTDFVIRWSPKSGIISFVNQVLSDELGIPAENLVGQEISTVGGFEKGNSTFAKLNGTKEQSYFENEVLRYDASGKEVFVSGSVRPILDDNQNIETLQMTCRNVTDQYEYHKAREILFHLQEAALPGNETKTIESILELGVNYLGMELGGFAHIKDDILEVSATYGKGDMKVGDKISLSDTVAGRKDDTNYVLSFEDVDNSELAGQTVSKTALSKSFICTDMKLGIEGFGRIAFRHSKVRERPFTDEEKMFVRMAGQTIENLSVHVAAQREMEYHKLHYLSVYDQAPFMRCNVNNDGEIVEANVVWQDQMGVSEEDSIGTPFVEFIEDPAFLENWKTFPRLKKADDGKYTGLTTLLSPAGKKMLIELTATKLIEPRTKEPVYLLAMVDVTEKWNHVERIESQNVDLEKANRGLSTFAYIASHDLQEPLRKIRQFAELLENDCAEVVNEDAKYYLDVITGASARISYLVKDILAYTTASNAEIEITQVNLSDILKEAVEETSAQIAETSAKVSVQDLPKVKGDQTALKLLFVNLISNALKYQDGKVTPKVDVKSRSLKNHYVIDVIDNGIGIQGGTDRDIFDPFVRLHSKVEFAGSGIGLAICKSVCDRMGWEISHKPNPSGGTIFSIKMDKSD